MTMVLKTAYLQQVNAFKFCIVFGMLPDLLSDFWCGKKWRTIFGGPYKVQENFKDRHSLEVLAKAVIKCNLTPWLKPGAIEDD